MHIFVFFLAVSENLVLWRIVLKRQWSLLQNDMEPSMLISRLGKYLPSTFCTIVEGTKPTDVKLRVQNATTLVIHLLQQDDNTWPDDLIEVLNDTGQNPLASKLQQTYQIVVEEQRVRAERLRAGGVRALEVYFLTIIIWQTIV